MIMAIIINGIIHAKIIITTITTIREEIAVEVIAVYHPEVSHHRGHKAGPHRIAAIVDQGPVHRV